MKITDIKAFPVQVAGTQLVVKVETDAGIYGVGEAGLPKRALAVIGAIQHYREFLVGARSDAYRWAVAGDVSEPVFRGRTYPHRRDCWD